MVDARDLHTENSGTSLYKLHISRVPTQFTAEIVERIFVDALRGDSNDENIVESVELIYPREDDPQEDTEATKDPQQEPSVEHRGFGFVTLSSQKLLDKALKLQTLKGGKTPASTKLYTMHLRPYRDESDDEDKDVCYLWNLFRCPYGDDCKFRHVGEGGCLLMNSNTDKDEQVQAKKKRGKCFAFKKKGKCAKGDDCPFSHDFEPTAKNVAEPAGGEEPKNETVPKSQKDCINWKTKGKCRKGDNCEYRHDPQVQEKALEKKRKRQDNGNEDAETKNNKNKKNKVKQPLSIRVFGMNYDTTQDDIMDFLKDCGKIHKVEFPVFEDSGRSKGYCGVWFASPKAVAKALELDGQELHGRWLRIQSGKMLLREWEGQHGKRKNEE
mmetsp:Transcript_18847/g.35164  ORF Transcript_18847/g.35164 Transcript_18847/m.35164 type:complete len:383 (+) Transcript_18847:111-1259(+)|eukprot:CAMPEP_0178755318 /NCGR_PEP_ID=MMETSP0744-20121128/12653_1 /TAXON_ID=913974 /ORGANISM="Nitzschia punctata, Strain CCMP561" /LENGTH=382 /DNA_ID=CAMNT_0020409337 /DNA_START=48 /DNA_END=1196 /DNA_ORIENTATION=-